MKLGIRHFFISLKLFCTSWHTLNNIDQSKQTHQSSKISNNPSCLRVWHLKPNLYYISYIILLYEHRFRKKLTRRKKLLGEELLLGEFPLPINELKENANTTTRFMLLHLLLRDGQILHSRIIHFCNTPKPPPTTPKEPKEPKLIDAKKMQTWMRSLNSSSPYSRSPHSIKTK